MLVLIQRSQSWGRCVPDSDRDMFAVVDESAAESLARQREVMDAIVAASLLHAAGAPVGDVP